MSNEPKVIKKISYTTGASIALLTFRFIMIFWWLSGIAIATSKWWAVFVPPYALYKVVEKILQGFGVV